MQTVMTVSISGTRRRSQSIMTGFSTSVRVPIAAGDQQQVERRTVGEAVVGDGRRPLAAAHRPLLLRDGDDVDHARHVAEHLQRPEHVEQLEAGEQQGAEAPAAWFSLMRTSLAPTARAGADAGWRWKRLR